MSKQTEALKLALEALEGWGKGFPDNWGDLDTEAVTALREALSEEFSGTEQPDKGPWHVGVTRNDSRVYLQSNDFKHDVRLYVDGDFADLKQRIEYAERLKRNMNGEDHPAQPQQEPVDLSSIRMIFLPSDHPADKVPFEQQKAFVLGWNGALDAIAKRGPLYTSPPAQRKPLTFSKLCEIEEAITDKNGDVSLVKFARAVEAAHGIK